MGDFSYLIERWIVVILKFKIYTDIKQQICHQNALFDILYNTIIWKYEKNNHVAINWSCDRGQHYNLRGKHSMPLPSPIFLRSILSLNSELWPQIYAILFEESELRTELSKLHENFGDGVACPVVFGWYNFTQKMHCINVS